MLVSNELYIVYEFYDFYQLQLISSWEAVQTLKYKSRWDGVSINSTFFALIHFSFVFERTAHWAKQIGVVAKKNFLLCENVNLSSFILPQLQ